MNDHPISGADALQQALEKVAATQDPNEDPKSPDNQLAGGNKDTQDPEDGSRPNPQSDPLEGLDLEALTVEALLANEKLGPKLKAYADTEHANQMRGQTDKIRQEVRDEETPRIQAELAATVQQQVIGQLFGELDRDVNVQELLKDHPDLEQAYHAIKANGVPTATLTDSDHIVQERATVLAYASRITALNAQIQASDLPAEVKDSLQPEGYSAKHPNDGAKAMDEWTADVLNALVKHEATKLKTEEWEAFKEEQLAELEKEAPLGQVRGRRADPQPDVVTSRGVDLLERALSKSAK